MTWFDGRLGDRVFRKVVLEVGDFQSSFPWGSAGISSPRWS